MLPLWETVEYNTAIVEGEYHRSMRYFLILRTIVDRLLLINGVNWANNEIYSGMNYKLVIN